MGSQAFSESGLTWPGEAHTAEPHYVPHLLPTTYCVWELTDPFPESGTRSHLLALGTISQVHLPGTNVFSIPQPALHLTCLLRAVHRVLSIYVYGNVLTVEGMHRLWLYIYAVCL